MDPSQTVHLPGFLHSLEPTLNQYGYLAVAGFVLLEDFGVPVPGETILILGAVYAGTGRLSIWLVALLGFLAAVAGDNIGFAIGHFGGRALVERFGRYVFLTKERLDKATDFFERRGGWIIIVARFIEGLRQANGIIAGISGMHWAKFLAFNTIGAALWVAVWTSVGYFAGNNITSIYNAISHYTLYVAIGIVVLLLVWIGRRVWRKRRERAAAATGEPAHAPAPTPAGEASAGADSASEEPQAAAPGDAPHPVPPGEAPVAAASGDAAHPVHPGEEPQAAASGDAPHPVPRGEAAHAPALADPPSKESQPPERAEAPSEEPQAQSSDPDKEPKPQPSPSDKEPQPQASARDEEAQTHRGSEDESS